MAAPTVQTTSSGASLGSGGNATSHSASYPSGITSGDLVIAHIVADGSITITVSDFTQLEQSAHSGGGFTSYLGYRNITGSEGATFTVGFSASEAISYECFRVSGHEDTGTQAPEYQRTDSPSNDTTPDPPSITPTGGSKDYLILAFSGNDTGNMSYSAWPYANNNLDVGGNNTGNDVSSGACNDAVTAATINPGTFTISASRPWVTYTVAVHPTGGGGGTAVPVFRRHYQMMQAR